MRRLRNLAAPSALCLLGAISLLASARDATAQRLTEFVDTTEINRAIREDRYADIVEFTTVALRGKISSQTAAQLHLARAKGEMGLHDLKDCQTDIADAIKLDPKMTNAYAARAGFEELDGKWAAAAADRTVALNEKGDHQEDLAARANDYDQAGKKALARRDYDTIARQPAKKAEDYRRRGEAFSALGREEQAAAAYAAARRLGPSDKWTLNGIAWFEATSPDPEYRDGRAAIRDATRAADLSHWKEPDILDTLAAAYAEAGDFTRALRYENQALASHESNAKRQVLEKNLIELRKGKPIRDHGVAE